MPALIKLPVLSVLSQNSAVYSNAVWAPQKLAFSWELVSAFSLPVCLLEGGASGLTLPGAWMRQIGFLPAQTYTELQAYRKDNL